MSVKLEKLEVRLDLLEKQHTVINYPLNEPLTLESRVLRLEQQLTPHVKFVK